MQIFVTGVYKSQLLLDPVLSYFDPVHLFMLCD